VSVQRLDVHIDLNGEAVRMGAADIEDRGGRTVRSEFVYDLDSAGAPVPRSTPHRLEAARHVTAAIPHPLAQAQRRLADRL
jgi:hypothetical protein